MKKAMTILALFVLLTSLAIAETQTVMEVQQLKVQPVLSGTDSPMINPATKSRDLTEVYFEDFETGAADWTTLDETATDPMWHIDTYNAYGGSGMSWWMGDPDVGTNGGYLDGWYQVLDTPVISVPNQGRVVLTFEQWRNIEDPAGASSPWDGWDGFNIRIRLEGEDYSDAVVLTDCSPAYNATSMYSFGLTHGEDPDGIPGIPGWGGNSDGWVSTTIQVPDSYSGDNVIISFAFASDGSYNTENDTSMWGVFIDNISLGTFYNTGDDSTGFDAFSNVPVGGQLWHIYDDDDAPSPTHAAGCFNSDTGYYNPGMDDYYITPEFDLPANVDITWDMYVKTGFDDSANFPDCDYMYVQVRYYDSGEWSSWNSVSNPTGDPNVTDYVFTGDVTDWTLFSSGWSGYSDMSALGGFPVQFRVGIHSNDDAVSTLGIRIDNFEVMASLDVLPPTNLIADYNGQTAFVDLDWDPPHGGGGDMQWDDGTFENAISFTQGTGVLGALFPVGGQCQILEFTVFSKALAGGTTIGVFEKVGANYSTTPSYSMDITTQVGAAASYDVSDQNWIVQNSFILGYICSSTVDCSLDETTVPSEYSYFLDSSWATWADIAAANGLPDGEWGIRCTTTYATVTPPNSYNVYRGIESGNYDDTPVGNATDTLFTDQTVEAGNTYYYGVKAVYDAGESQFSNEASAFVEIATAVEYAYDDGTAETSYCAGSAGSQLAVRITPDQYPAKLIRIKYYLTEVNQSLIVYAWDDDGVDGQPGTQLIDPLCIISISDLVANDWNVITIPETSQFWIYSGDFYVGWFESSNNNLIGVDTDGYIYNRSWQYSSGIWYDYTLGIPQNMMIRAVVDTWWSNDDDPVVGTSYLRQNFPNPVKGSTTIQYNIKNNIRPVEINIYNILGQKVDSITGENGEATWTPSDLPSGIYFYKINTAEFTQTRKMLLIK